MKKRVIALMLAFVLVLNMGAVAFATGEGTPVPNPETEPTPTPAAEATPTPTPAAEATPTTTPEVEATPMLHYGGNITWKAITETVASGTCGAEGDNLTWTLDSDGVLTISGTGAMKDYPNEIGAPWAGFPNDLTKVVIEEGITTIGASAFMYCGNLTEVVIPGTVTSIGSTAFLGLYALK